MLASPTVEMIDIQDIAYSLASQCRFNGHTDRFYSVAEHSCILTELLTRWALPPEKLKWALLHDAAEAYLGDLAAPLKAMPELEGFRTLEERILSKVAERFGLEGTKIPDDVAYADVALTHAEASVLMPKSFPVDPVKVESGVPQRIRCLSPPEARAEYLRWVRRLWKKEESHVG